MLNFFDHALPATVPAKWSFDDRGGAEVFEPLPGIRYPRPLVNVNIAVYRSVAVRIDVAAFARRNAAEDVRRGVYVYTSGKFEFEI